MCTVYCLCVNVYCTAATGCQPNCSHQIYHIISYRIISLWPANTYPASSESPLTTSNLKGHYRVSKHPQHPASPMAVRPLHHTLLSTYLKKCETKLLSSVPPVLTEHCCLQGPQHWQLVTFAKSNSRWRWMRSIGGMVLAGGSRRTGSQICHSDTLSTTNPTPTEHFIWSGTEQKRHSGLVLEYGTRIWREMYICFSNLGYIEL